MTIDRRHFMAALVAACASGCIRKSGASVVDCGRSSNAPLDVGAKLLVDRTCLAETNMRHWLDEGTEALADQGSASAQVVSFSNAVGLRGLSLGAIHTISPDLSEETKNGMRRSKRTVWNSCRRTQVDSFKVRVSKDVQGALGEDAATAQRSDIVGALHAVGKVAAATKAERKLLVVVSDGYQYMGTSAETGQSFYENRQPRLIDVQTELKLFERRRLGPTLDGMGVFWLGLGIARAEIDYAIFANLEAFWREVVIRLGGQPLDLASTPVMSLAQVLERDWPTGPPPPKRG